jgi:hypothetical protein
VGDAVSPQGLEDRGVIVSFVQQGLEAVSLEYRILPRVSPQVVGEVARPDEPDLALGRHTLFKLGLDDHSDLELNVTPYVRVKGEGARASGFGDTVIRYKNRLTSDDTLVQVTLLPFIKLPTARHDIGDGKVEGGLAVPISFALAGPVSATLGPEVDVLADLDGHGRHASLANVLNLSATVAPGLSLSGELWGSLNFDPANKVKQASADAAVAYLISNNVQLDAGANFGLTRETPDIEFYAGISIRP